MHPELQKWISDCQQRVETAANKMLPQVDDVPSVLHEAMRYSVMDGGKRVRPLLVYATGEMFEATKESMDSVALAIECVHSYSLIHDDMPCMDNDVLRHGKPTTHKKYGEAMAMLAGDALQPEAFLLLSQVNLALEAKIKLIEILARACSTQGMCGGQAIDLLAVGQQLDFAQLRQMHERKTGALLLASVLMGAYCGRNQYLTHSHIETLTNYGKSIGLAFQIVDDILDVTEQAEQLGKTAGKDVLENKPTYVTILGLEKAKALAQEQYESAIDSLSTLKEIKGVDKLFGLAQYIVKRNH